MLSFRGQASTGATYEIELRPEGGAFAVEFYAAGAGAPRKSMGKAAGLTYAEAVAALLKKAKEKRAGRDRAYVFAVGQPGVVTPDLPKPAADGSLAPHPQLSIDGQTSPATPMSLENAGAAAAFSPLPVALCKTITDPEPYLTSSDWIATRKVEGRRAQLHITAGQVVMTNRSGGVVECPADIARFAAGLPDGSYDGELVAMDAYGRESLFVGGAAQQVVFVAFDIVSDQAQWQRRDRLRYDIEHLGPQTAIQVVEFNRAEPQKREMLERARAEGWEGLVFRDAYAPYIGGRHGKWVRFKLRRREYDLVVMGYSVDGKGVRAGTFSALKVGLYDGDTLVSVGEVGGGIDTAEMAELHARQLQGKTGYVITATAEGMSFNRKLIRPSFRALRPIGDKSPLECRFESEVT